MKKGLLQVYTGDGKGKTTASLGLALRASGHGWKVLMIQFMKGRVYGELPAVEALPNITIEQYGRDEFVDKRNPEAVDVEFAEKGFERAKDALSSGEYDIVILDEINVAVDFKLVSIQEVIDVIKGRAAGVEVVCTGRYAPAELIEIADLVTEMKEIKHPYNNNIPGRLGIEF